jgi:hypothetical protein
MVQDVSLRLCLRVWLLLESSRAQYIPGYGVEGVAGLRIGRREILLKECDDNNSLYLPPSITIILL